MRCRRCQKLACNSYVGMTLMTLLSVALACRVTAHFVPVKGMAKPKTTILMKFEPSVMSRSRMPV